MLYGLRLLRRISQVGKIQITCKEINRKMGEDKMSKVMIEGMEMPKSCDKCRFVWPKRYDVCCLADKEHKIIPRKEIDKPSWCPLQEVKG